MKKSLQRNSNLELLRIVSMFFIVLHHFAYHGSSSWVGQYTKAYAGAEKIYLLLSCLGKAAVVAFVIIGAYFLSQKKFKLIRVLHLCFTTLIYSWLIFLVLIWKFPDLINIGSWNNIWAPIPIPSNYWFVIAYVYMLLCMPFMNLLIRKLTKRQICTVIFLFSFLWTIVYFMSSNKLDNDGYSFFTSNNYFLLIYLIGGYIRKYQPRWAMTFLSSAIVFIACLLFTLLIIYKAPSSYYGNLSGIMATLNNPISLILGVSIFVLFKNINIGSNVVINYISKSMFGVYLIHDNSFIRPIIWQKMVNTHIYAKKPLEYLQYGLKVSIIIFVYCILIDILKRLVIDPIVNVLVLKLNNLYISWSSH